MTWKAPLESNISKLWAAFVPATSTVPVHQPRDGIRRLSATLRMMLDGLSGVSRCLCECHFEVHIMFLIARVLKSSPVQFFCHFWLGLKPRPVLEISWHQFFLDWTTVFGPLGALRT